MEAPSRPDRMGTVRGRGKSRAYNLDPLHLTLARLRSLIPAVISHPWDDGFLLWREKALRRNGSPSHSVFTFLMRYSHYSSYSSSGRTSTFGSHPWPKGRIYFDGLPTLLNTVVSQCDETLTVTRRSSAAKKVGVFQAGFFQINYRSRRLGVVRCVLFLVRATSEEFRWQESHCAEDDLIGREGCSAAQECRFLPSDALSTSSVVERSWTRTALYYT
ncbi:unnamed protein product [Nesidiocoris tenuis]|uniref:Uncharacterized protein n=1 Tax=Nesidiocoris tenuis TaxID=355587 RepID=A0A6H5H4N9_9HEMI|nr:unnamed protein product [Nesidiocoris tenuis]